MTKRLMNKVHPIEIQFEKQPILCSALGNVDLLDRIDLAFFCSSQCPGSIILKTQDLAYRWRQEGTIVVGGFHSPIEKEVLIVLLGGAQPIVICPARNVDTMRVPSTWKERLKSDRMLIVSPFDITHRRTTKERAWKRNEFAASLTDKVFVPYASSTGKTEEMCRKMVACGKELLTFDDAHNENLMEIGATCIIDL